MKRYASLKFGVTHYLPLLVLVLLCLLGIPALAAEEGGFDHSKFSGLNKDFTNASQVTLECLKCHEDASKEMMATTHWTWEYETRDGQKLGKNNVINNYCVAVSSNWPRCTSCHVGYGYTNPEAFAAMDEQKVDCLICHDLSGTYKKFPAGAGHPTYEEKIFPAGPGEPYGKPWHPVDLKTAAQSVGLPTRANCGSCHFNGGGGANVKHGDLDNSLLDPNFAVDVHMDANGLDFTCQTCHVSEEHQIAGSRYEMDMHGETSLKSCKTCHENHNHSSSMLNSHTDKIACQTCHIPVYAKENYVKTWWDWSTAGELKDGEGDFEGRRVWIVEKDENKNKIYMSPKGTFEWDKQLAAEHSWSNGNTTYITLDDTFDPNEIVPINRFLGDMDDPNATIIPVRSFAGMQPYDAITNQLVVPNLFPTDPNRAYWKNWDWAKAIEGGQESVGREFSGEYGFVQTVMYWPITHQVSPADQALSCKDCHNPQGALDFAALGYSEGRVTMLTSFYDAPEEEAEGE